MTSFYSEEEMVSIKWDEGIRDRVGERRGERIEIRK
jgi:hypothetical protein